MNSRSMMTTKTGRLFAAAATLAMILSLGCLRMNVVPTAKSGLTNPTSEPRPVEKLAVPREKDPTKTYRIGSRDILKIDVRKDPAISQQQGYMVTEEGNILLPYLGPVKIVDMTVPEAESKINSMLAQYIREPDAKVGIQEYRSKFVNVVGQVMRPGRVIMRADQLTLQEAILQAGMPTPDAAMQRTQVITPAEEHPIVRQIDLTNILYKGRMAENMMLKPGDIVFVPAKQSANLTAALRDLIRPIDEVVDVGARASYWMNNNNNNNSSNNNNNTNPGGIFGN